MSAAAGQGGHIPALDGLRAVSIAIVFAGHAGLSPLIPGGFGVTVFFFLSGFLITTLLAREVDRRGGIALGAFFARRALRLAPPLTVSLALIYGGVAAGLVPGDLSPGAILSQLFYVHNYYIDATGGGDGAAGLAILWSLAVEEHFYLIWPFLFLAVARGRIGPGAIAGLALAILLWRAVRVLVLGDSAWTVYILTDTRFDSLLYGCLLALLDWRGISARIFPGWDRGGWAVFAAALAVLLLAFLWRDPLFRSTLRYSLQGLALMAVFHYAVRRADTWPFRPLEWGWVRRIGLWSYTIYIVHYVIILTLREHGLGGGVAGTAILAAALSLAYAAVLYRVVERPAARLRARLRRA